MCATFHSCLSSLAWLSDLWFKVDAGRPSSPRRADQDRSSPLAIEGEGRSTIHSFVSCLAKTVPWRRLWARQDQGSKDSLSWRGAGVGAEMLAATNGSPLIEDLIGSDTPQADLA